MKSQLSILRRTLASGGALLAALVLGACVGPMSGMTGPESKARITLLAGTFLVVMAAVVVAVFFVHKLFQEQRQETDLAPKSPRIENEASFAMAAMQGVIARMKEQEKELTELRRAAEQRAKESARISENIIREMPSGLMVFNREGFITAANPAVRIMLGVDTWSRRRYPEILGPQSSLAAHIRECLATGKTTTRETIEYLTPRGDVRLLGMSLSSFHGAGGELDGAVCLLSDLTETRQLQEQIRLKEHLAALGTMSAGIAHEFKNSLASISGYAQLLRDGNLSQTQRDCAEKIVNEIRSLTRVVTDFLALSKPLTVAAIPVDVRELLLHAMEDLKKIDNFKHVALQTEGNWVAVEGDEVLLRQALSNLLRNACEAQRERKETARITIRGEVIRQGGREFLKILIEDAGQGILPADREKIFVPFFTTKASGSGLGLALVQKIVVSHNGLVNLESTSPEGTTFSVVLPLLQNV
ncbi:MAG TPA: ATP-binding protein [Terriglobia bacterium]|nr:ATP-binding protein [Terriglobia bacterium]